MRLPALITGCFVATLSLGCDEKALEKSTARSGAAGASVDAASGSDTGGGAGTGGASTSGGAGSGGAATGGSTSSGGAGGTSTSSGGAPDAGPDGSDAGSGPNPATVDVVGCKDTTCSSSEVCCYSAATLIPPAASTFACSSKPCTGTQVAISCDGAEDCDAAKKCCRVDSGGGLLGPAITSYACGATCAVATIACGGPDNCAKGEVCCDTVLLTGSVGTACQATCVGVGLYTLCRKDADCPSTTPTCVESTSLPGFRRCQ